VLPRCPDTATEFHCQAAYKGYVGRQVAGILSATSKRQRWGVDHDERQLQSALGRRKSDCPLERFTISLKQVRPGRDERKAVRRTRPAMLPEGYPVAQAGLPFCSAIDDRTQPRLATVPVPSERDMHRDIDRQSALPASAMAVKEGKSLARENVFHRQKMLQLRIDQPIRWAAAAPFRRAGARRPLMTSTPSHALTLAGIQVPNWTGFPLFDRGER
jgi:hypothetical protein